MELVSASNPYSMKGSSLEVSFPLAPIRKALGDLTDASAYVVRAYTCYPDDQFQNYRTCDVTRTRLLRF